MSCPLSLDETLQKIATRIIPIYTYLLFYVSTFPINVRYWDGIRGSKNRL